LGKEFPSFAGVTGGSRIMAFLRSFRYEEKFFHRKGPKGKPAIESSEA
jgi:hypothetical protein